MSKKGKYKKLMKIVMINIFILANLIFGKYQKANYVHADEADLKTSANLTIDNKNVYNGMKTSYSKGYTPTVNSKNAVIVLPLLSEGKLKDNKIRASVKLDESENFPFVCKNYEKSVKLSYHKTRTKTVKSYLVNFNLELKNKRYNGTYPVAVSVAGIDNNSNAIYQDFTIYVTILNGTDTSAEQRKDAGDKKPTLAPKVMIHSCKFSKNKIICGEKFTANIKLYNTNRKACVKNMMVTVQPGENVELLSKTDSSYIRTLDAGTSHNVSFVFRVASDAPKGQYNITVNLDYADETGNTYTVQENVRVFARQKTKMEIAPVSFPKSIQLGETVDLQAQVMNLGKGKIYHVRAILKADGLTPSGQIYIGDMEGGTESSDGIEVTAEGLSGDSLYGKTQGKINFYYEDEMGNKKTQSQDFETSILSPLSDDSGSENTDDTGQWWIIMAIILIMIFEIAVIFVVRRLKQAHMGEVKPNGM